MVNYIFALVLSCNDLKSIFFDHTQIFGHLPRQSNNILQPQCFLSSGPKSWKYIIGGISWELPTSFNIIQKIKSQCRHDHNHDDNLDNHHDHFDLNHLDHNDHKYDHHDHLDQWENYGNDVFQLLLRKVPKIVYSHPHFTSEQTAKTIIVIITILVNFIVIITILINFIVIITILINFIVIIN